MTDHIDLDEIEQRLRAYAKAPNWLRTGRAPVDCEDGLALVRAVRAAMAMEPWRVVDVYRVGVDPAVAIQPTQALAEALAPFRKEDPK